jgi:hypothetical protein
LVDGLQEKCDNVADSQLQGTLPVRNDSFSIQATMLASLYEHIQKSHAGNPSIPGEVFLIFQHWFSEKKFEKSICSFDGLKIL